jgi:hypothetical protein
MSAINKFLVFVGCIVVSALTFYVYSERGNTPGEDFAYGECIAAYGKFSNVDSDEHILDILKYEYFAVQAHRELTTTTAISLEILKNESRFNNYLIHKQISRYIGCRYFIKNKKLPSVNPA